MTNLSLPSIQQRHAPLIASIHGNHKARRMALVSPVTKPLVIPAGVVPPPTGGDDSALIQALADRAGYIPLTLPYKTTKTIVWSSNTTVEGFGLGGIYNPDPGVVHHVNRNFVFNGDENRIDHDIRFLNVRFSSDPNAKVDTSDYSAGQPIVFYGIAGLSFAGSTFTNYRMHVMMLANNKGVNLDRARFVDFGQPGLYTGAAGGMMGGVAVFGLLPNYDVSASDIYLTTTCRGLPLWFDGGGNGLNLSGVVVEGGAEAALVGFPPNSTIDISRILGIRRYDVSGHGMETGGHDWSVRLGVIDDCDGANWYVTDPVNVSASGGCLSRANQIYDDMTGSIIVRTLNTDPTKATNGLTVSGVTLSAPDGKGAHAFSCVNFSGNAASVQRNVNLSCNPTGDAGQWKTGALGLPAGVWDKSCSAIGNPGIKDVLAA